MDFLESQRTLFPDLEEQYVKLLVNHQARCVLGAAGLSGSAVPLRKPQPAMRAFFPHFSACRLWHQLTETILSLFTQPGASRGDNFIQVRRASECVFRICSHRAWLLS